MNYAFSFYPIAVPFHGADKDPVPKDLRKAKTDMTTRVWGEGFKGALDQRPVFLREPLPDIPTQPPPAVSALLTSAMHLRDSGRLIVRAILILYAPFLRLLQSALGLLFV